MVKYLCNFFEILAVIFQSTGIPPGHTTMEGEGQVSGMKELRISAERKNLHQVLAFVDEQLEAAACPLRTQLQLEIAAEEIFVNIASYAYGPEGGEALIRMAVSEDPPAVTLEFEDSGMPFDPLAKEDPDVTLPADKRKPGNLGIFMVKKSMDDMRYEYKDGRNRLILFKKL